MIRRKRTWRETNKSLQVGETVCKDMDMAKRTMYEQKSKESYLIGAGYLGGLESSGKWVPILVSSGCYITSLASLVII